jgi:hypothetical protein
MRLLAFLLLPGSLRLDFDSPAASDTNNTNDIFVHDRVTGETTRVSVSSGGQQSNDFSWDTHISADGLHVVFSSFASNLVAVDANDSVADVFVHDRNTGLTTLVSVSSSGQAGNSHSIYPRVSADGRIIVFGSEASNLVAADTNDAEDVFVHDRTTGRTVRVSVSPTGQQANANALTPRISSDGRFVAFTSPASNLVAGDTGNTRDVFVVDWQRLPPVADENFLTNGDFTNGMTGWGVYAAPSQDGIVHQITGGVFEFFRTVDAAQAVVLQEFAMPPEAASQGMFPLEASFSLGNSSSVRKRVTALLHAGDFSDLQVCTFWLEPNTPLRPYLMQTHTTLPWTVGAISFYASNPDGQGWIQLDRVIVRRTQPDLTQETRCIDPRFASVNSPVGGANLIVNGDFSAPIGSANGNWGTYGQISYQVNAGVFEFQRLAGDPAGVVLQNTSTGLADLTGLEAQFDLGNSSPARQRVTVLLHASNFSDLQVCTFWLPPSTPMGTYVIRTYTPKSWTQASISFYASTVGGGSWLRLDNVSLYNRDESVHPRTFCYEPGATSMSLSAPIELPMPTLEPTATLLPPSPDPIELPTEMPPLATMTPMIEPESTSEGTIGE